jgi:hypothetical protein
MEDPDHLDVVADHAVVEDVLLHGANTATGKEPVATDADFGVVGQVAHRGTNKASYRTLCSSPNPVR